MKNTYIWKAEKRFARVVAISKDLEKVSITFDGENAQLRLECDEDFEVVEKLLTSAKLPLPDIQVCEGKEIEITRAQGFFASLLSYFTA